MADQIGTSRTVFGTPTQAGLDVPIVGSPPHGGGPSALERTGAVEGQTTARAARRQTPVVAVPTQRPVPAESAPPAAATPPLEAVA